MTSRKPQKIPKDWVFCPVCGVQYAFIKCRYTIIDGDGVRNMCLHCAVIEKRSARIK